MYLCEWCFDEATKELCIGAYDIRTRDLGDGRSMHIASALDGYRQ